METDLDQMDKACTLAIDMNLHYTQLKQYITSQNLWGDYNLISADVTIAGNGKSNTYKGFTKGAHTFISHALNHRVDYRYRPTKITKT